MAVVTAQGAGRKKMLLPCSGCSAGCQKAAGGVLRGLQTKRGANSDRRAGAGGRQGVWHSSVGERHRGTAARRDMFGNLGQHTGTGGAARLQGWPGWLPCRDM